MASNRTEDNLQAVEALYHRATRAELDKSFDQAFELYVKAAQSYLHLVRGTSNERDRKRLKEDAQKCLERAERIKATKKDLTPLVRNPFSEEEQSYVLERSSYVHSLRLPLWKSNTAPPDLMDTAPNFSDPDGQPSLAPFVIEKFPTWRRPHKAFSDVTMASWNLLPDEIIQNVVTDCSVCTSIAVCLHHHRRFNSKLGLFCTFPQDSTGIPRLNQCGKYVFRLFFNGAYRRIGKFASIDDCLPFYPDGTPISVSTSPNFDLWPSLIEKAYMKLMGGYDFPGSASSIDILTLTGWIPEHMEIRSPTFEREKAWSRIMRSFTNGSCVLTLGTGQRDPVKLRIGETQLLPTHSYAIVDICESDGERWFTVLNPMQGSSLLSNESSLEDHLHGLHLTQRSTSMNISWNDVCDIFDGIYLNWDYALFQHRIEFHGLWRPKSDKEHSQSVHYHLRIEVPDAKPGDEVWVLLIRHVVDKRRQSEYIAVHVQQEETTGGTIETRQVVVKGTYTNNTYVLARYNMTEPISQIAIMASYDGEYEDVGFTVNVFSATKISWIIDPPKPVYSQKLEGVLASKNAGGNSTYPTFMNNPQYRLRVYPNKTMSQVTRNASKTTIRLVAEGPRYVPLSITVVWSKGERICDLAQGDILASSGAYSYGIAHASTSLSAGEYTVIVSAFEPRHRGPYSLEVESSSRIDIEQIPSEGAGLFCKTIRGIWESATAGGGPTFGHYSANPAFEIDVQSSTHVKVRLQLTKPSPATAINATIFARSANVLGRQIATSGPYSDAISGVITPQVSLSPGKYLLVPSTYDPGIQAAFQIFLFSKASDVRIALMG